MICPDCASADTKVIDSRLVRGTVLRRRECQLCGRRYTTLEVMAPPNKHAALSPAKVAEIAKLAGQGYPKAAVAEVLGISEFSARKYWPADVHQ